MDEILSQLEDLRGLVEKQQEQILYQQSEIEQCRKILNHINLINLEKLKKFLLENR